MVVFVFQLVVSYLPLGRRLYAIGSNPDAARIAGFPAQRIVFMAFVMSGALAGLAGFMFLARFGNITVVAGQGLELESVAAVVVGGVSTNGGIGSAFGAFLGAILIDVLAKQPDPLAGDQRVLARRAAGPADPAGGRHRHRDHESPAQAVGAARAPSQRRQQRRRLSKEAPIMLASICKRLRRAGKGCCCSS